MRRGYSSSSFIFRDENKAFNGTNRLIIFMKEEFVMKNKIMNFAVNNWSDIAIVALVAIGEACVCKIYKDWLNKH